MARQRVSVLYKFASSALQRMIGRSVYSEDAVVGGWSGGLMALVRSAHRRLPGRVSKWSGTAAPSCPAESNVLLCLVR